MHMLGTGLTSGGERSDRCELKLFSCPVFKWFAHWFTRSCIGSGGACMCAGGTLCVFFELCFGGLRSLLELCFVSGVSSCCPCLRCPILDYFK
jgi:hypothetical protein